MFCTFSCHKKNKNDNMIYMIQNMPLSYYDRHPLFYYIYIYVGFANHFLSRNKYLTKLHFIIDDFILSSEISFTLMRFFTLSSFEKQLRVRKRQRKSTCFYAMNTFVSHHHCILYRFIINTKF